MTSCAQGAIVLARGSQLIVLIDAARPEVTVVTKDYADTTAVRHCRFFYCALVPLRGRAPFSGIADVTQSVAARRQKGILRKFAGLMVWPIVTGSKSRLSL